MSPEEQKALEAISICIFPTGSRIICNPPVLDTDEDWYVLINDYKEFDEVLDSGYTEPGKDDKYDHAEGEFVTYRKGTINLIVTTHRDFFLSGFLSTALCQQMNALSKDLRINVFSFFRQYDTPYVVKEYKNRYMLMNMPFTPWNLKPPNRKARRAHLQRPAYTLDELLDLHGEIF